MSHKWKHEGLKYLYFVDTPTGLVTDNNPSIKTEGKLIREGLMHEYICEICNARCVNAEERPIKIPQICTYDLN